MHQLGGTSRKAQVHSGCLNVQPFLGFRRCLLRPYSCCSAYTSALCAKAPLHQQALGSGVLAAAEDRELSSIDAQKDSEPQQYGLLFVRGLHEPSDLDSWAQRLNDRLQRLLQDTECRTCQDGNPHGIDHSISNDRQSSLASHREERLGSNFQGAEDASSNPGTSACDQSPGAELSAASPLIAASIQEAEYLVRGIDAIDSSAASLIRVAKYLEDFHPSHEWRLAAAAAGSRSGLLRKRLLTHSILHSQLSAAVALLRAACNPSDCAAFPPRPGILQQTAEHPLYTAVRLGELLLRNFDSNVRVTEEAGVRVTAKRKEIDEAAQVRRPVFVLHSIKEIVFKISNMQHLHSCHHQP